VVESAKRFLYVVVARRIPAALLKTEFEELTNCSDADRCLLLSPVVPSSEAALSDIACLLGYFNHDGLRGDAFVKVIAQFTGFAPLICSLYRIIEKAPVCGRDIVAVTASLFGFYQSQLLPETCLPSTVFEYLLQCSSFVLHGFGAARSRTSRYRSPRLCNAECV
jgi:hypothetical protein